MTIGIVTISYNQGAFLEDAINSVRVQPPHGLEYVVVDPGSTDDSRQIISRRGNSFASIIFEPDSGPADGLNKGFAALKSAEICGYINADDRFTPGALDCVCDFFAANPSIDVFLGGIFIIDRFGSRRLRSRQANKLTLQGCAEQLPPILQQATFFRRGKFEAAGGFNTENRTCWDSELVVDLMVAGSRISYTSRVLGEFRIHQSSLTGSQDVNHQARYERDKKRIAAKIWAAGYKPTSKTHQMIANNLNRVDPFRHATSLAIGLGGVLAQQVSRMRRS